MYFKRVMNKVEPKNCEYCRYATLNNYNFQKHLNTKKHKRNSMCVENLHTYYLTDNDEYVAMDLSKIIIVNWDGDNDILEDMMINENKLRDDGINRNCMWVEKIKEKTNWTKGSNIYFINKSITEGQFLSHIKDEDVGFYFINEYGILMVRKYHDTKGYDFSCYVECDCVYNDKVRYELELEECCGCIMK